MGTIITIGREFGSGGRELGRRLADALGIAYYDKEILLEVEKKTPYCMEYLKEVSESRPAALLPIHYGVSFGAANSPVGQNIDVFAAQAETLKELASKSSCVIIGRAADSILKDFHPFRIFVYADMSAKIARCKARETGAERLDDSSIKRKIKSIDKKRANYYEFFADGKWGAKENYDLLINTTNVDIKKLAESIAKNFQ